jgi:membrane protein implicated in regulation of membrane protease activity
VVASLTFTEWTEFDKKLILGTAFVIAACCILAYNRMLLVVGVAFMFAARGVLVLFFVSSAKMKVFAAALIMAAFFVFARFRNQPLKPYSHEQNS